MKAEVKKVKKVRIPAMHSKTVAAKVRYLNEQGLERAEIARQLDIRYQRVRNVLVPRKQAESTEPETLEPESVEPETDELEVSAS